MGFFKQCWFWLRPWLGLTIQKLGPVLVRIAMDAVLESARSRSADEDKRDHAAAIIRERLAARGFHDVSDNQIHAAIETALANHRRKGHLA